MSSSPQSEFVDAAACGDLDGVKSLLSSTTPPLTTEQINAVDKDGRTAFHYSCLNDDVPLLTILLSDSRVTVTAVSPKGDTALHMASLYASLSAMSLLFQDSRTNINAQNKYGETPLHLCAGSGDKGATKAAKLLLEKGASLTILDKWGRGPKDVSHDNAENPLVTTFQDYLSNNESVKQQVEKNTNAYMKASRTPVNGDEANRLAKTAIFGGIGKGLAGLKKTKTSEKTMFAKSEGLTFSSLKVGDNVKTTTGPSDGRKALSKLVDFPGDLELIKTQLLDLSNVDPAGADSYGLTALHKFASWNKTLLLEVLLPHLTSEDLMRTDPAGKTALHWAVEMASVASVKALVAAGVDVEAKDGKGYTVRDVLDNVEMTGVIQRLKDALVLPKLVKQEA